MATVATSGDYADLSNKPQQTMQQVVTEFTTNVTTGDGQGYLFVTPTISGMNLVGVYARVITAGTTGTTQIQISRNRSGSLGDMLSTKLTIDSSELDSTTAASQAVINGSFDDVLTTDLLRIDVDAVTSTPPKGLIVSLMFS